MDFLDDDYFVFSALLGRFFIIQIDAFLQA